MNAAASKAVTPFTLSNIAGDEVRFAGARPAVVCFVKEDCPTCREVMPVLAAMYEVFAEHLDFHVVGQTGGGNAVLTREFAPPFSLLDDSALRVSFESDIETVPTLRVTGADGTTDAELVGFVREEWQATIGDLRRRFGAAECALDWLSLIHI